MMDDAIRATLILMEAPSQGLSQWRAGYNVRGLTFSAIELATMIIAKKPGVEMRYVPDDRQKIADSGRRIWMTPQPNRNGDGGQPTIWKKWWMLC